MKHLLITGSSGLLGSNINLEIGSKYEAYGISQNRLNPYIKNQFRIDLAVEDEVRKAVDISKPDYVIHCAAVTNIDLCETDYNFAYQANVAATNNLISLLDSNTKFIYISTDALFDGTKGDYSEEEPANPLNNYAKTKLDGEKVVESRLKNYCIVRTNIFGKNRVSGESFAEWIINNLKNNKKINMFTDVIFSPLSVKTLADLLDRILNSNITGKINLASSNAINKYSFGRLLAKTLELDENLISPVSVDSFPFKAKRPKNMSLNVSKAKNIFGCMPTIENEIAKFTKQIL